jgi:hypothetical protein
MTRRTGLNCRPPQGSVRACAFDRPSSPLIAAGGASTDVAGSRRVRVGPGVPAMQGEVSVPMMNGLGNYIQDFHRRRMGHYGSNAFGDHTRRHSLEVSGTATVIAVAAAGNTHAGGHIHHLDAHAARLNRRQAHSRGHEDCKQQDEYPPDQRLRHGNLQPGGNVWQNQAMNMQLRLCGTGKVALWVSVAGSPAKAPLVGCGERKLAAAAIFLGRKSGYRRYTDRPAYFFAVPC